MPRLLVPISVLTAALLVFLLALRPGCQSDEGASVEVPTAMDRAERGASEPRREPGKIAVSPEQSFGTARDQNDDSDRPAAISAPRLLLAEGIVRDDLDRPCPGVLVQALAAKGLDLGSAELPLASGRSDARGRFRLFGPDCRVLDLRFEPGDQPLRPVILNDLPVGRRDLEVCLTRAAGLRGSLIPPEDLSGAWFTVILIDEATETLIEGCSVRPDGAFYIEELDPGMRRLLVGVIGAENALIEIPSLFLMPGEVCEDPRLQGIDLGLHLDCFEIEVVDDAGAPLNEARVLSVADQHLAGTPIFSVTRTNAAGRARLPIIPGGLGLEIGHPGFGYLTIEKIAEDRRIRLVPAATIELRIPAPDLSLPPDIEFVLRFRNSDKKRLGSEALLANRVPEEEVSVSSLPAQVGFALQRPGEYEIIMSLRQVNDGDEEVIASVWLGLDDSRRELTLPLAARRAEFERALDRLQTRR